MGVALATRSQINLSVQHDRAPLFVKMQDGALRNGYTVKIANKTQQREHFSLTLSGLDGAGAVGGRGPARAGTPDADAAGRARQHRHVPGAGVRPAGARCRRLAGPVDFVLRNTTTGEQTVYHSVFMGPGAPRPLTEILP